MAINISNLNISLDKFNAESSGTYNIGQMKLSSDGKSVYRTNTRKTWTIFNSTKISSEEALAVKFAFCKALKKEGLSKEAIAAVKAKLGIPGDALDALKAGNIKPLTAAEVREIIDQYAEQINKKRASASNRAKDVKALKTSEDLYKGVGRKELENRATTRNEINAKSIDNIMTGADKAVNNLLDILQFGENGGRITPAGKNLAREILTMLSNPAAFGGKMKSVVMVTAPIRFTLQSNGNIVARLRLGNGNFFSIDTGLDRNGLVDKAAIALNWTAATNPRVEKKVPDDEFITAIDELETGEVKTRSDDFVMSNKKLLSGLRIVFNALKEARGPDARRVLRDAKMEDVVKALQQALDRARRLDNRNTKLINDVREVFYGNPKIDADNLLKEISDVLNKMRVNSKNKKDENIPNQIEEDLDKNLNINAWLN